MHDGLLDCAAVERLGGQGAQLSEQVRECRRRVEKDRYLGLETFSVFVNFSIKTNFEQKEP